MKIEIISKSSQIIIKDVSPAEIWIFVGENTYRLDKLINTDASEYVPSAGMINAPYDVN